MPHTARAVENDGRDGRVRSSYRDQHAAAGVNGKLQRVEMPEQDRVPGELWYVALNGYLAARDYVVASPHEEEPVDEARST